MLELGVLPDLRVQSSSPTSMTQLQKSDSKSQLSASGPMLCLCLSGYTGLEPSLHESTWKLGLVSLLWNCVGSTHWPHSLNKGNQGGSSDSSDYSVSWLVTVSLSVSGSSKTLGARANKPGQQALEVAASVPFPMPRWSPRPCRSSRNSLDERADCVLGFLSTTTLCGYSRIIVIACEANEAQGSSLARDRDGDWKPILAEVSWTFIF